MRALRLVLLAFALSAFAQTAPGTPSDDTLVDQVRIKLSLDVDVNGGALEVNVKDGVVTLRGPVRNEKSRKKAEKIAAKVKGIKKVINEITLSPTAP
jgi:hyperosmotically inducible periplasmic protein